MSWSKLLLLSIFCNLGMSYAQVTDSCGWIGKQLPAWEKGELDIHLINTGRGETNFMILPDGTTLMVDAGELILTDPRTWSVRNTSPKPDGSRYAYEWTVYYLNKILPSAHKKIDYALITHFHDDHYGSVGEGSQSSRKGNYLLSGITGVGEFLPIGKIVDRGYPEYKEPYDVAYCLSGKSDTVEYFTFKNYLRFIEWHRQHQGMEAESFKVGSSKQFVLKYAPEDYPEFSIRNLHVNGVIWDGIREDGKINTFPDTTVFKAQENCLSAGIRIDYGKFRFYLGGDIPGYAALGTPKWNDVASAVAPVIGRVDVAVMNHHGGRDALSEKLISSLAPRVWLQHVWSSDQPGLETFYRVRSSWLYEGERDLFSTNLLQPLQDVAGPDLKNSYESCNGHIVLRVQPDGRYTVFVLDSDTPEMKIKGVWNYCASHK